MAAMYSDRATGVHSASMRRGDWGGGDVHHDAGAGVSLDGWSTVATIAVSPVYGDV